MATRWLTEEEAQTATAYVQNFRSKLKSALSIAHKNLTKVQGKMKSHFDKANKVEFRAFNVGEKVLALLPLPGQPLQSQYSGPFRVIKRVGEVNYVIDTPERRKKRRQLHVNLLKRYYSREDPVPVNDVADDNSVRDVALVVPNGPNDMDDSGIPGVGPSLTNSLVLNNLCEKLEHLTAQQASDINGLLQAFSDIFSDTPRICTVMEHDVNTGGAQPVRQAPYRLNAEKRNFLKAEVQRLIEQGLVRPSISPWASPVILVPKSNGTLRLVIDFRPANRLTVPDSYPLPRMDDIIDDLGQARYVSKLDLLQGYYQVALTERARPVSAFITPDGLYEFTVLPFGMRNGPATFQRLMNYLTADLEGVRCYLDDLVIWSHTWSEHLVRLESLLATLSSANLTVNLVKSEFGHARVTFLGHVVGQGQVAPMAAKVEAIRQYPIPSDKKAVMRFMGLTGYYRRFCKNFSQVSAPLTNLLSTKQKFDWSPECQQAFENLKNLLISAPVLQAPDVSKPFILHVDASDCGVGAVLLQRKDVGIIHPVCYFSHKFKSYQKSYATVEKEALGIVLALEKFKVYLTSSAHPIEVFTDHNPLTFLESVKFKNVRVLRWALALQPYNLKILHIKGRDNVIADALSRF